MPRDSVQHCPPGGIHGRQGIKVRLIVTGGGTGGHIYPAVSIIKGLKEKHPSCNFLFVGSLGGMEEKTCAQLGVPFKGYEVSGIVGKRIKDRLSGVFRQFLALGKCLRVLRNYRPSCVVGTGGYASAPACLAALLMRIPFVLVEVNIRPGAVNRFLSRWARVTAIAHEETGAYFPSKASIVLTGVPVRSEILRLRDPEHLKSAKREALKTLGLEEGRRTLTVFGGSQGAKAINEAVLKALPALADRSNLQIVHITGMRQFDSILKEVSARISDRSVSLIYRAFPYIERMDLVYAASDMAVTRAGALTVAELIAAAVPAVLVPLPGAAGGHQRMNALKMKTTGAAYVVEQDGNSALGALHEAVKLIENQDKISGMKKSALQVTPADGVTGIIALIERICCCLP